MHCVKRLPEAFLLVVFLAWCLYVRAIGHSAIVTQQRLVWLLCTRHTSMITRHCTDYIPRSKSNGERQVIRLYADATSKLCTGCLSRLFITLFAHLCNCHLDSRSCSNCQCSTSCCNTSTEARTSSTQKSSISTTR